MTERKPPGRSWEWWLEEQIRQAREDGAFDNLDGAGKPLPDLDQGYDPDWWMKKLVRREQVSALPPALELLRKVETELARIWKSRDEAEVSSRCGDAGYPKAPRAGSASSTPTRSSRNGAGGWPSASACRGVRLDSPAACG